mgnify:CR=1 FL=1
MSPNGDHLGVARGFQSITAMSRLSVFTAPAKVHQRRLDRLSDRLDAATADGRIDRTERQALRDALDTTAKKARGLVAYQHAPVQAVLSAAKEALRDGTLVGRSDRFEARLERSGDRLVSQATRAAESNPLKGWKRRFPGIATRDFTFKGLKVNAVAIDLADPRVRLQTNSQSERGRTVDGQAKAHHAEIAINGDFFSLSTFAPSGLAETNGQRWSGTSSGFEPSIAFTGRHAELLPTGHHGEPGWADNVVSARPAMLVDGKVLANPPGGMNERTARTGVGLSKSGRVLYLVAVEGRSGVKGLTATELGQLLKSLGADDGMAMDGGGSAQMYQRGRGLVKPSTDPGGRRGVANVLMVQSRR